jgi:hypothetical protein
MYRDKLSQSPAQKRKNPGWLPIEAFAACTTNEARSERTSSGMSWLIGVLSVMTVTGCNRGIFMATSVKPVKASRTAAATLNGRTF